MQLASQHKFLLVKLKEDLQVLKVLLVLHFLLFGGVSIDKDLEALFDLVLENGLARLPSPTIQLLLLDPLDELPLPLLLVELLLLLNFTVNQFLNDRVALNILLRLLLSVDLLELLLELVDLVLLLFVVVAKVVLLFDLFLVLLVSQFVQVAELLLCVEPLKLLAEGHHRSVCDFLKISPDENVQLRVALVLHD